MRRASVAVQQPAGGLPRTVDLVVEGACGVLVDGVVFGMSGQVANTQTLVVCSVDGVAVDMCTIGDLGTFHFDGLPPGVVSLCALSSGWPCGSTTLGQAYAGERMNSSISIEGCTRFTGRVVEEHTSIPIAGAVLSEVMVDGVPLDMLLWKGSAILDECGMAQLGPRFPPRTISDKYGAFSILALSGDSIGLEVTAIDHEMKVCELGALSEGTEPRNIVIEMRKSTYMNGRVVGEDGAGVAGASVVAIDCDHARVSGCAGTDLDGSFKLDISGIANCALSAYSGSRAASIECVRVETGQICPNISLQLRDGVTLRGVARLGSDARACSLELRDSDGIVRWTGEGRIEQDTLGTIAVVNCVWETWPLTGGQYRATMTANGVVARTVFLHLNAGSGTMIAEWDLR